MGHQGLVAFLGAVGIASAAWSQVHGAANVWTVQPQAGAAAKVPGKALNRPIPRGSWPVSLTLSGNGFPYTPTLCDVDGDGAAEIFVRGGHTFALDGDGAFLPGWPTAEMAFQGYGTNGNMPGPSVADVDSDGDFEVFWTVRDWFAGSSVLHCFNGKNIDGTNVNGFPQNAPGPESNSLWTPFVLADTNADGNLEAWGSYTDGIIPNNNRISAFDHLGTRLFVRTLDIDDSILSLYHGDLDGDGQDELFGVSLYFSEYRLRVFNSDGSDAPGYPVLLYNLEGTYSTTEPPTVGDVDGDGDLEFVFGHWNGSATIIDCRNHDGSPMSPFPVNLGPGLQIHGVSMGDVTADGNPEIIATAHVLNGTDRVFVMDATTGAVLPGWPYEVASWPKGFPTIADVDGNGVQDVVIATDSGELFAIGADAALLPDYPKTMHAPSISGVAAGDIDGDQQLELVAATWDGWVYRWDTPASAATHADWPMRGVDARSSGVYKRGAAECRADFNNDGSANSQDFFDFLTAFFKTDPSADFNKDGSVNSQDFFDFLTVFFAGCP